VIANLRDQLERDEGRRAAVYPDSLGYWTIGVGICVDARKGCGLLPEEIDFILDNRIAKARKELSSILPWTDTLDPIRRDALVNLVFNLGISGLVEFRHFLAALQLGDWQTAKAQLLDSTADHQEPARIGRLAEQILTGQWQ